MASKNKDVEVLQSNALTESAYTLTLQQKRVIMLGILNANKSGVSRITIKQFSDFFGVRKNHAKAFILKERASLIASNVIIHKENGFLLTNWVTSLFFESGDNSVVLTFTPEITKEITALKKQFTKYSIIEVGKMKNFYIIRIYLLLCQWRAVGSYTVKLKDLRDMLQLNNKHKLYSNFKIRILQLAEKEITEKTNFTMRFEEIKKERSVESIKFIFYEKIPTVSHD